MASPSHPPQQQQHPDAEFDPALDDDFDPAANGGCGGLRGDPGVSDVDPETGLPTQFLLRIGFAPELLGGWVSLKAESSLLSVHLLNYLLLEQLLKRRRINLVGLDHTQIALARCVGFERTGVIPSEESVAAAVAAGAQPLYEEVHDETAVGDVWGSQSANLAQNSSYKLNPALPVLYLFLRSNQLFGSSLAQVQMRVLLPPGLVSVAPKDAAAAVGLVTSPVQYLDASGKRAIRLCAVATRTSVWEVRHLDDFSICEDNGDEAALAAQAGAANKQPIVYIRDQFYRFLTAAVASPAQAAPWVPDPNDPAAMPPPRPPTEVGTVLVTASHHDEASKWVIEAAPPAAAAGAASSSSSAPGAPQSFLLRNFNLLSPAPGYLYLGLTRDMDGVLQPALVDRSDALRVELTRPLLSGWLEKRPKGEGSKPAKKGDKFLRRFFLLESGAQGGTFGYFGENATVNAAAGFDPRVLQQRQAAGALKRSYNLHPATALSPKKEPVQFASASTLPADPQIIVLTAKKGVKGAADLWLRAGDAATAARWATALQAELAGECFLDSRAYATQQPVPAAIFAVARVEFERAQREAELREEMEDRAAEEAEAARQQQLQQGTDPQQADPQQLAYPEEENVNPPYDEHPSVQQQQQAREHEDAEAARKHQEQQALQDAEYQDQLDYEREQQFSLDPYAQFAPPRPRQNARTQQQPPQQPQPPQSQQPQRPPRPNVARDGSVVRKPEEEEKSGVNQNAGPRQQQGGAFQQQNQAQSPQQQQQQQNKGAAPLELRASRAQADGSASGPNNNSLKPPVATAARATTPSNLTDRSSSAFDAGERTAHMDGGLESGRSNVESPAYDPFAAKAEDEMVTPAPAPVVVAAASVAVADPEPAPKPISNAAPSPSGPRSKPPPNAQAQLLRAISSVASGSPKQGSAPAPVTRAGSSLHSTPAASPSHQPQPQPQPQSQPAPLQKPEERKSPSAAPVPVQQQQAQSQPPPVRPAPLTKKPSLASFNSISPKASSQPSQQQAQQRGDAPPNHRRGASSLSLDPPPKSSGAPPPQQQQDESRDQQINDLKAQLAAEQALASLEAMRPASPNQQQQPQQQQTQQPKPASSSPPRAVAGAQPNQQAQAQALAQAAAARHAKQHGTAPAAAPAEEPAAAEAKEDDLALLAAATLRKQGSVKKKKSTQRTAFVPLGGAAAAQDNSSTSASPDAQPIPAAAAPAEPQLAQTSSAPAPAPAPVAVTPNLVRKSSRALPATPTQQPAAVPTKPQEQPQQQQQQQQPPQEQQRTHTRQQTGSSGPPAAVYEEDEDEMQSVPQPRKAAAQENVARSAGAGAHGDAAASGGSPALNPTPLPPQPASQATQAEPTPAPSPAPAPAPAPVAAKPTTAADPAPRRQADEPMLAPFVAPQFPTQLRAQPPVPTLSLAPEPTPAAQPAKPVSPPPAAQVATASTATSPASASSSTSSSGPTALQADACTEFSGEGEGKVIVPFAARAEDPVASASPSSDSGVAVSPLAPWSRAQASFYDAAPSINKVITPSPAAFTDPHFSIVDSAVHQRAHLSAVPQPPTTTVEVKRSVTTSEHDSPAAASISKADASTSANARPRVQARAPVLLEPVWDDGDSFEEETGGGYYMEDAYGGRVRMARHASPLHQQGAAFINKPPSFAGPTSPLGGAYRGSGATTLPPRHAHGSTHKVLIPTQYKVEARLAAQQQQQQSMVGLDDRGAEDQSAMTLLGLRRPLSMEELEARWKNDMILAAAEGARQAIQQQAQQGLLYSPYASPMQAQQQQHHHRGSSSQGSGSFGSSTSGGFYSPPPQSRSPQLQLGLHAGARPEGSPLAFGSPQSSPPSNSLLLPTSYAPIAMGPLPSLPPEPTEGAAPAAATPAARTPTSTTPPSTGSATAAGGSHYTASAPFVASLSVASPPPPTFGLPAYQRVGGSAAPQQTPPPAARPASYEFGAASAYSANNASPLARAMAAANTAPYSPQQPQQSPYSFSSPSPQSSGPTYVARPLSPLSSGGVMQGYSRSAVSPPPSAGYPSGYAGIHGAAGPVSPPPAVFVGSAAGGPPMSPFASPLRMSTFSSSAVANGFTPAGAHSPSASVSQAPQSQAAYEGQQALILSPNSNTPSNARLSFTRAASTAAAVTAVSPSAVHLDSQLEALQKQLQAFKQKQQQLQAQLGAPATTTNLSTAAPAASTNPVTAQN